MRMVQREVSKMDIKNLENNIKVLEKKIHTLQGKHEKVQSEIQAAEKKQATYFGTVQKENQVKRIKFLDEESGMGTGGPATSSKASAAKQSQYLLQF